MERLNMGIAARKTNSITHQIPTSFLGLQKKFFILRPIHKKSDYQNAIAVAEELSTHNDLTAEQADYREMLTKILADYETRQIETSKYSPVEMLKFLVEENQMSSSDLGRILGNRTLGSAILRGERKLSKTHIVKLAKHFSVNPALFLDE
jgi:HTH-type transcriptional regulator / antitoxin HigA